MSRTLHAEPAFAQPPRARLSRLYIAVWAVLAGLALVYLALLALRPDLAERLLTGPSLTAPEDNRGQRANARMLAELDEIRSTLARLQQELQEQRTSAAARDLREQALMARVAALEAQSARVAEAGGAMPAAQRAAVDTAAATMLPPPAQGDRLGQLAGAAVTGTVEERPAAPPRPAQTAGAAATPARRAGPPVSLQLATGPSLDALRLSWSLLQETHRATLRTLEPRYQPTPGEPGSFTLLAGPVGDAEAAGRICERLKAKRIPCSVTALAGQALPP